MMRCRHEAETCPLCENNPTANIGDEEMERLRHPLGLSEDEAALAYTGPSPSNLTRTPEPAPSDVVERLWSLHRRGLSYASNKPAVNLLLADMAEGLKAAAETLASLQPNKGVSGDAVSRADVLKLLNDSVERWSPGGGSKDYIDGYETAVADVCSWLAEDVASLPITGDTVDEGLVERVAQAINKALPMRVVLADEQLQEAALAAITAMREE